MIPLLIAGFIVKTILFGLLLGLGFYCSRKITDKIDYKLAMRSEFVKAQFN